MIIKLHSDAHIHATLHSPIFGNMIIGHASTAEIFMAICYTIRFECLSTSYFCIVFYAFKFNLLARVASADNGGMLIVKVVIFR